MTSTAPKIDIPTLADQDAQVKISIKHGSLISVVQTGRMHTRGESTVKMVIDALIGLFGKQDITRDIVIHIGDHPRGELEKDHFYYCVGDESELAHAIPDFIFDSWKEPGIAHYGNMIDEIIARGQRQKWKSDKLFWIGNQITHKNRFKFMRIAKANADKIEAYNTQVKKALAGEPVAPYVSLPDHCDYKYLIDIEGVGYSGRIPFLLATQRLLFIQERKWRSYFHFDLQPYKHFVPVKNDLSDLMEQLEFVENQGSGFYNKITDNALQFVQNKLTYAAAIENLQQKLLTRH
ncbi:glycosyltransferase family 90 protein [Neisseria perflava]|uniref:glycosyltransferase family 90 protein n=1 Tax=Neisseria perflava TaxID=33053 RepID=UPI00209D907C|nr:glycosyltransferase family 90 protein [Neisseria perflava]MCP1659288.1 hypothetical protein [Neisseria perflava]MCP1772796.1 hypothetical protein [Neisseria perflava]